MNARQIQEMKNRGEATCKGCGDFLDGVDEFCSGCLEDFAAELELEARAARGLASMESGA